MTDANVNQTLLANMFDSDFQSHLKATDVLSEDLDSNRNGTVANLDLILKWFSLRFFNTKTSVLLEGLTYLRAVFTELIPREYVLSDYEASCFVPYLIPKIGDRTDTVRELLSLIKLVYPAENFFAIMMKSLKSSQNATARAGE
ncbi:protein mini spindles-like [Zootermopsis nevadensis]|uniref:protein mini spindles-like n=1 Tax=Zootermopsis nevadensis TaxID=136037 RepID=UPI000B8E7A2C|nr:protein mini spindles-like [Zootermopsis nevadensis]